MIMDASNKADIIIIDDNLNDIDIVKEILETQNELNVISFLDPETAITYLQNEYKLENHRSCLVLMDLNMPQKNGFELLKMLKSNSKTSHIQVLIYSSSKRKEDILKAYSLGASSYIIKPLEIDDIKNVLENVVSYWTKISVF